MNDLRVVPEVCTETLRCKEGVSHPLPGKVTPPVHHANLLAISSHHGHTFAAAGDSITVFTLASLRGDLPTEEHLPWCISEAAAIATVSLSAHSVEAIASVTLILADAVLAITRCAPAAPLFVSVPALIEGRLAFAPAPPEPVARALAVVPSYASASDVSTTHQLVAVRSTTRVTVHSVTVQDTTQLCAIPDTAGAPSSVALAPAEDVLAVGTDRGVVAFYNPRDGTALGSISAVESGWIPFTVYFAGGHSLFVSYAKSNQVFNIMWELRCSPTAVSAHSSYPLGELCYGTLNDNLPDGQEHPCITCMYIPDWSICLVGSSLSPDVELLKRGEDLKWTVWKQDEGKDITLPNDEDFEDTKTIGLALDFNDTRKVEPDDPGQDDLNPMPHIHVLTTDSVIIPYRFINKEPGVKCSLIREPGPIPPAPKEMPSPRTVPPADPEQKKPARPVQEESLPVLTSTFRTTSSTSSKPPAPAPSSFFPSTAATSSGFGKKGQPSQINAPFNSIAKPPTPSTPQQQILPSVPGISSTTTSITQSRTVNSSIVPPMPAPTSFNRFNTSNSTSTIPALGKSTPSNYLQSRQSNTSSLQSAGGESSARLGRSITANKNSFADPFVPPQPNSSIASPLVQPSRLKQSLTRPVELNSRLNEVFQMTQSTSVSGPLQALRSILLEMSAELSITREAHDALRSELATMQDPVTYSVNSTRKQLENLLNQTKAFYDTEKQIRSTVIGTMRQVLSLQRKYESIHLEHTVRQGKGAARELSAENKAADESMAKKESEMVKAMRSIETRLRSQSDWTRGKSVQEIVQRIYSSLSLQGIRIKRLLSTLNALTERVTHDDRGGRQSDLGLSLARLEKLSLHSKTVPTDAADVFTMRDLEGTLKESDHWRTNSKIDGQVDSSLPNDGQLLNSDVRDVMRRLAMQGGRSSIKVGSGQEPSVPRASSNSEAEETYPNRFARRAENSSSYTHAPHGSSSFHTTHSTGYDQNATTAQTTSNLGAYTANSNVGSSRAVGPSNTAYHGTTNFSPNKQGFSFSITDAATTTGDMAFAGAKGVPQPSFGFSTASRGSETVSSSDNFASTLPAVKAEKHLGLTGQNKGSFSISSTVATSPNKDDPSITALSGSKPPFGPNGPFRTPSKQSSAHSGEDASSNLATPSSGFFAALPPDNSTAPLSRNDHTAGSFFAALPPDSHSTSAPQKSTPVKVPFAGLPPDDSGVQTPKNTLSVPFARLPSSEDNSKSSSKPPSKGLFAALPPEEKKPQKSKEQLKPTGTFAALPPDDTTPKAKPAAQFAALPPDDSGSANKLKPAIPSAPLPPSDAGNKSTSITPFATLPPGDEGKETKTTPYVALPPHDEKKSTKQPQFAALPPDGDDDKTQTKSEKASSKAVTQFASLPPDEPEDKSSRNPERKPGPPPKKSVGFFAALPPSETDASTKVDRNKPFGTASFSAKPFGEGEQKQAESKNKGTPLFGTAGSSTSPSSQAFGFGAASSPFGSASASTSGNAPNGFASSFPAGAEAKSSTATENTAKGDSTTTGAASGFATLATGNSSSAASLFGGGTGNNGGSTFGFSGMSSAFGTIKDGNSSLFGAAAAATQSGQFGDDSMGAKRMGEGANRDGGETTSDESDTESGRRRFGQSMEPAAPFAASSGTGGFGSTGNGFGSASGSAFGSTSSAFGNNSFAGSGFGNGSFASTSASASGFGGGLGFNTPAPFGAAPSSGFASASNGAAFGSSTPFGASGGSGSEATFGASSTFGAASTFGTPSKLGGGGGFGAAPAGGGFGSTSTLGNTGGFAAIAGAQPQPPPGGGFGAGAPASGSGFAALASSGAGGLAGAFGNGAPPAFTSASFSDRRF